MTDLKLNKNFSVHLDDTNDLATVSGREEFEQSVVVKLNDFIYDLVGDFNDERNLREKITLRVSRVARSHNMIDSLSSINVSLDPTRGDTVQVEVEYTSGDLSTLTTK